jgi:hypothetical protein
MECGEWRDDAQWVSGTSQAVRTLKRFKAASLVSKTDQGEKPLRG